MTVASAVPCSDLYSAARTVKKSLQKKKKVKKKPRVFYKVNTYGWISIRDYSKKRIYLMKNGQHLEGAVFSGSMKDAEKSLALIIGNEEDSSYMIYAEAGKSWQADEYIKINGTSEELLAFRTGEKFSFVHNGKLFGTYGNIESFMNDSASGSWAVKVMRGADRLMVINGTERRIQGDAVPLRFIKGTPVLTCASDGGVVVTADGKPVLKCSSVKVNSFTAGPAGAAAFIYSQIDGEYVYIDGNSTGPYRAVHSLLAAEGAGFAYIFENSGVFHVNVNGTEMGPYESADSLALSGDRSGWVYRYKKEGKYFVAAGAENFGPYDYADKPEVAAGQIPPLFSGTHDGVPFVYINGKSETAAGTPVSILHRGIVRGYIYGDKNKKGVYSNGRDYGLFDEIGPVALSDADGAAAFFARKGRENMIVTAKGITHVRDGIESDSVKLTLDGKTAVFAEKSSRGAYVNIGSARIGPYDTVMMKNSIFLSDNEWLFFFSRERDYFINRSGTEIRLYRAADGANPAAALGVDSENLWYAQTVSDDGFFIIVNGTAYGPDAVYVKNYSAERILYWITIEGRSVYLNKKRY